MTLGHAVIYVIVPLMAVSVGAISYMGYVRADSIRIARHEYWSDRFYAAATALVENDDTPAIIISLIETMNKLINTWIVPSIIHTTYAQVLVRGHETPIAQLDDAAYDAFVAKCPDAPRQIREVAHAGLLAMTYAALIGGTQARSVLADVFGLGLPSVEWKGIQETEKNVERRAGSLVPLIPLFGRT